MNIFQIFAFIGMVIIVIAAIDAMKSGLPKDVKKTH